MITYIIYIKGSSKIQILNKKNNYVIINNFINKNELHSKSLITDNKNVIIGIYLCLYKQKDGKNYIN